MSVQEYLDKHMLSRRIEDAVNAAVRAKAPDPVLFISKHMSRTVPSAITKIKARQILDSKGIPAVEVDLYTNKGMFRAAVPCGEAEKTYQSLELYDGDKGKRIGYSVSKAVRNINDRIAEALIGMDPTLQSQIDHTIMDLDKTDNKAEIGLNATLPVSIAACKAGAAEKEVSLSKHIADLSGQSVRVLPVPAITVVSSGKHTGNNLAAQEIMILPVGANTFEEAVQMGTETYYNLRGVILKKYGPAGFNAGEDGGLTPNITDLREALDLVKEAIDEAGFTGRIKMAINVAAANLVLGNKYNVNFKSTDNSSGFFKTGEDMAKMYAQLCSDYPIVSIEDPFDSDDWGTFKAFTELGVCQVVGDCLLISDSKRMERAIKEASCSGLLLKVNQFPTITEAIEVAKQAKDARWGVVVSQASVETEDSFIADLAVGLASGQIKAGAPCRGEHITKYNQLLRIEEELGNEAVYAGENWRSSCP